MPSAPKSNEGISTARPASLLLHGTWDRSRTSLDRSLILIAIVIVVVTASLSFFMARGTLERLQDERRARHAAAIDAFGAALNAQLSAGTRLLRHVARQPEKLPLVFEDGVVAESVVGTFHFDGELRCLARTTEAADESLESEIVALAARAREDARVHVVERAADGRGYLAVLQRVHAAGRGEESLILLFDAHALIETFLPRAPELSITRITTESGEGLFERRDARAIDAGRTSEFAIRLDPQTRAFVECDTGPELELPLGPVAWGLAMLAVAASVLLSLRSRWHRRFERKLVANAAVEREYLVASIEDSSEGTCILDASGRTLYANAACRALFEGIDAGLAHLIGVAPRRVAATIRRELRAGLASTHRFANPPQHAPTPRSARAAHPSAADTDLLHQGARRDPRRRLRTRLAAA